MGKLSRSGTQQAADSPFVPPGFHQKGFLVVTVIGLGNIPFQKSSRLGVILGFCRQWIL